MKNLLTISFLFLASWIIAQPAAFKKIMADKQTDGDDVFFERLREYQKENIESPEVYFQLGKMELRFFSELDPIVDRVSSRQFIYNAKINLGLAKNYLEDKDITKNPDWFDAPVTKDKDSIILVTNNQLSEKYDAVVSYASAYEDLIFHYDKAVSYYLKAREDFIGINNSADNLRELFLEADDSLRNAVKHVGESFDSSMFHLDKYRSIYRLLPHDKKRTVAVNLNEIDHFRMNGITPTNFLADEINVWSYKAWSDDFLNLIEEEVDGLQDEIRTAYQFFDATNDRMMNGDECIQANVDDLKFQRIVNLVTKYDKESVLIDIFNYLMRKLDYGNLVTYEKNCNELDGLSTEDFLSRKARINKNLFFAYSRADSTNRLITTTGHNQESFQWFFDEMMPGENGSANFSSKQSIENKSAFKRELENLNESKSRQQFKTDSSNFCLTKEGDYLVNSGDIVSDTITRFCVSQLMKVSDTLTFILGQESEEWKLIGAMVDEEDYRVLWSADTEKNDSIDFYKVVTDSSFVIGGVDAKGWFKHISISGNVKNKVVLKNTDPIRDIGYNELRGAFTLIQGNEPNYTYSTVNFDGLVTENIEVTLPGTYLNHWVQDQKLWFFSYVEDASTINATVFDPTLNEVTDSITYQFSSALVSPLLIKNDNEYITLVSGNGVEDELIYALLDYQGTTAYEKIF